MWTAAILALASLRAPADIGFKPGPPSPVADSLVSGPNSGGFGHDPTQPRPDSLGKRPPKPPPPPPPYRSPPWSWEIAPHAGVLAASFQQRSHFSTDLSTLADADTLTTYQSFPGSDLAWKLGTEFFLRRFDAFRLVLGFDWSFWSAQAIAGRSDSITEANGTTSIVYRSYGADLLTADIGFDLLIPKRILSVDAARDAFLGVRYRAGAGRLQGRETAWGWTNGASILVGADVLSWKRMSLCGIIGWSTTQTTSDRQWRSVLWNTSESSRIRWDGGGLALEFLLRWGPSRDSSGIGGQPATGAPGAPDQKK